MADDLVEERLAQIDFALPETRLIGALGLPPERARSGKKGQGGAYFAAKWPPISV